MNIDGKAIAAELNEKTIERVKALSFQPVLCDVLVGDDPVSLSYVKIKEKKAREVGLGFSLAQLPANASEEIIIAVLEAQQAKSELCGLIVQLPLPEGIDANRVLSTIDASHDVDCISPVNGNKFYAGEQVLIPPTAAAIVHILDSLQQDLTDKTFVVVGQGDLVGKPTTYLLRGRGYNVVTADKSTKDLQAVLQTADVVIAGVGKPGLITGDMIKSGAIVIDAGTSESGGSIAGDVDFASVEPKASLITPVPGGVGPVTVAKLLENVVQAAEAKTA